MKNQPRFINKFLKNGDKFKITEEGKKLGFILVKKHLRIYTEEDRKRDKIIAEEVRRKMDVLMDEVAARNFENKDDPITVISEYFKSDSAQKEYILKPVKISGILNNSSNKNSSHRFCSVRKSSFDILFLRFCNSSRIRALASFPFTEINARPRES